MKFNNVTEICTPLMSKARSSGFLQSTAGDIEPLADQFLDDFSTDHQMTAHSTSPFRGYFPSATPMYEDGVIELRFPRWLRNKTASCLFNTLMFTNPRLHRKDSFYMYS